MQEESEDVTVDEKNKWNPDSKTVKRAGGSIKKREFDAVVPSLKWWGKV